MKPKLKFRIKMILICIVLFVSIHLIQKHIVLHGNHVVESILQTYFNERMAEVIQNNQQDIIIDHQIDTKVMNQVLYECVEEFQRLIKEEQQSIITSVPIGALSGFTWLQDIGFHIPIKYTLIERVKGKIDVDAQELGINNTLIQINLEIEFIVHTSYSLIKKELIYHESLPLAIEYIQGEVPNLFSY